MAQVTQTAPNSFQKKCYGCLICFFFMYNPTLTVANETISTDRIIAAKMVFLFIV
jgi:hypothetical protein